MKANRCVWMPPWLPLLLVALCSAAQQKHNQQTPLRQYSGTHRVTNSEISLFSGQFDNSPHTANEARRSDDILGDEIDGINQEYSDQDLLRNAFVQSSSSETVGSGHLYRDGNDLKPYHPVSKDRLSSRSLSSIHYLSSNISQPAAAKLNFTENRKKSLFSGVPGLEEVADKPRTNYSNEIVVSLNPRRHDSNNGNGSVTLGSYLNNNIFKQPARQDSSGTPIVFNNRPLRSTSHLSRINNNNIRQRHLLSSPFKGQDEMRYPLGFVQLARRQITAAKFYPISTTQVPARERKPSLFDPIIAQLKREAEEAKKMKYSKVMNSVYQGKPETNQWFQANSSGMGDNQWHQLATSSIDNNQWHQDKFSNISSNHWHQSSTGGVGGDQWHQVVLPITTGNNQWHQPITSDLEKKQWLQSITSKLVNNQLHKLNSSLENNQWHQSITSGLENQNWHPTVSTNPFGSLSIPEAAQIQHKDQHNFSQKQGSSVADHHQRQQFHNQKQQPFGAYGKKPTASILKGSTSSLHSSIGSLFPSGVRGWSVASNWTFSTVPLTDKSVNPSSPISVPRQPQNVREIFPFLEGLPIPTRAAPLLQLQDPEVTPGLFQGDIALQSPEDMARFRVGVSWDAFPHLRWPNNTVPYVISPLYLPEEHHMIQTSIATLNFMSCVRFVPWDGVAEDYLLIWPVESPKGCWSYVGRRGGQQVVSLQRPDDVSTRCFSSVGKPLHELLHALGVFHEHTRADRDEHVEVIINNIIPVFVNNFKKQSLLNTTYAFGYDYDSVMHYGSHFFSKTGVDPTIRPLDPLARIGQREMISKRDCLKLNALYGCLEQGTDQLDMYTAFCNTLAL